MVKNKGIILNGIVGFLMIAAILFIYNPFDSPRGGLTIHQKKQPYFKKVKLVVRNDWLCIPGQRVGPITCQTSEEELRRIFGARNVVNQKLSEEEGTVEVMRTLIYSGQKDALVVGWVDETQRERVAFVRIVGRQGARWHTEQGITIGTTLGELNRLNGAPFTFYGFGWDYGGWVADWHDGKLQNHQLHICLGMADQSEAAMKFLGDGKFRSDAADLEKFGVAVVEMDLGLQSGK